ncbi:hypothetical protein LCGC14_1506340 [marine sediment metagenome]|uniref:Uncharacterized protein n=1 Tax=marine sediment metagenome TaxID=412755 RepID=A0A0F9M3Z8_9ZZZZ
MADMAKKTIFSVGLRGQILQLLYKDKELDYFEALMNTGKSAVEQNKQLLKILKDLRSATKGLRDPLMRFGLNATLIYGKDKKKLIEILQEEVK